MAAGRTAVFYGKNAAGKRLRGRSGHAASAAYRHSRRKDPAVRPAAVQDAMTKESAARRQIMRGRPDGVATTGGVRPGLTVQAEKNPACSRRTAGPQMARKRCAATVFRRARQALRGREHLDFSLKRRIVKMETLLQVSGNFVCKSGGEAVPAGVQVLPVFFWHGLCLTFCARAMTPYQRQSV